MARYKNRRRLRFVFAFAAATSIAVMPALAAETIKLTAIDGYPARALWVKEFSEFFIP
jgi:C4-dicarboxylate-binding protein DctP